MPTSRLAAVFAFARARRRLEDAIGEPLPVAITRDAGSVLRARRRYATRRRRSSGSIGTVRTPACVLGAFMLPSSSAARETRIAFASKSRSAHRSARLSPVRRPAYLDRQVARKLGSAPDSRMAVSKDFPRTERRELCTAPPVVWILVRSGATTGGSARTPVTPRGRERLPGVDGEVAAPEPPTWAE
jgi:hypothetical protein